MDPRRQLDRPLVGESLFPSEAQADRLDARLGTLPEHPVPVPARDERVLPDGSTRSPRRIPEAGPNAPQLIRLMRFPFSLRPGRVQRTVLLEPPEPRERVDVRGETEAAQAERVREPWESPGKGRPRAFAVRPSKKILPPP